MNSICSQCQFRIVARKTTEAPTEAGGLARPRFHRRLSQARGQVYPGEHGAAAVSARYAQEDIMAKGQMRGTKEKKKPKAEWNKKRKGGPVPTPFSAGPTLSAQGL